MDILIKPAQNQLVLLIGYQGNNNISFLACAKVELWDLTVCIVVSGENFHARCNLDLGMTMANIELVGVIFGGGPVH